MTVTVRPVNDAPVVTQTVSQGSAQYIDNVSATFTGSDVDGDRVTFEAGTLPSGLAMTALPDGSGVTVSGNIVTAPGSYPATVTAWDGAVGSSASTPSTVTFRVTPEDARATYTGATFASTSSATSSKASVTLSATVQDSTAVNSQADSAPGDIRNAKVSFMQVNGTTATAIAGCSNLSVGLVSATDPKTGTATCTWSVDIGSADSVPYTIGVKVTGHYSRDAAEDYGAVTVSKPLPGMLTGGGFLINEASSGLKPGEAGLRTNFGFNAKMTKTGALQGNVNVIVRNGGRVYQIKSNAITSLNTKTGTCSTTTPCTGTFNGKASIQDVTNPASPISVDGNGSMQISVNDRGEPGSSDDNAMTLWDKNGGLWFASKWDGVKTVPQVLNSGNIQVR